MTYLETRIAKALQAFHRSEGVTLTEDQFASLVDQMALACNDILTDHKKPNYEAFCDAAWGLKPCAP